jgi:uncharacterized protein (DUF952 family)
MESRSGPDALVYKICPQSVWDSIRDLEHWQGSADDLRDGFIHFSALEQVPETVRKHFVGEANLLLIAVDPAKLTGRLTWEKSRGGALFPHLYGPLPLAAVVDVRELQ